MATELPLIEKKLESNISKAVEGGMPLDTPLYGARGETLGDLVPKEDTYKTLAPNDPIWQEVSHEYDVAHFLDDAGASVDDLLPATDLPTVNVNTVATNKVVAAKVAALQTGGEMAMQTYGKMFEDLGKGRTDEMQATLNMVEERTFAESQDTVAATLRDPAVSDEEKLDMMNNFTNFQLTDYSIDKALINESVIANDKGENPRQEHARINTAMAIEEVNASKRQLQTMLNVEAAKSNTETMKALKDLAVFFTPYMEQSYMTQVGVKTNEDTPDALVNFAFLGESKEGFKNAIKTMPPEARIEAAQKLIEAINSTDGALPFEQNDYARLEALRVALEDGYYTDTDRIVDNLISMLDVTILGGAAARGTDLLRGAFKSTKSGNIMRDARRMAVQGQPAPTSLSQIYKDTNIERAKNAHEAAALDNTGEAAEALYGTNRTDAVANDILPDVSTEAVRSKVGEPDSVYNQSITPSPELMDFVQNDGKIHYWKSEKIKMRTQVVNDFEAAVGVRNRKEMNQIEATDDGVKIKAVYGTPQFGYDDAQEALDTVLVSLRDYGVTEKNLTLLGRVGDEYVPMTVAEVKALSTVREAGVKVGEPADFLVQVNHDYKFNPLDVSNWEKADVRRNFFDRAPVFTGQRQGSFARHLLDVASMLHPKLTLGANVAVDKAAGLERIVLESGKKFTDSFTKMKADRQAVVHDYIKQANSEGLDFNPVNLKAQGFSDGEIDAIASWRSYWDDMYFLDNRDLARTLNSQNMQWFVDKANDTQLFARPIPRNKAGGHARVYDPATGQARTVTKDELSRLYDEGGTIAQMRTPMQVGDEAVELVLSTNKAGGSYMRRINESDTVLPYRKGYYTVNYTAPKYIEKIVKNKRGEEMYRQAVAVAGNTKDAELMASNLRKTDGVNDYSVRGDIRKEGGNQIDGIDVLQARGRTAQRSRGKRLEEATMAEEFGDNFVMSPVDSMVLAARTTSARVAMRDYLEATKSRFVSQFGHMLQKDKYGRTLFPTNIDQITSPGRQRSKDIADARTTFEYINYLEKGYLNTLDESIKAGFNMLADIAGKYSGRVESGLLKAGEVNVTNVAKSVSFYTYLASNPLRQLVVQSHQMMQLAAFNPLYAAKQLGRDMSLINFHAFGMKLDDKMLKAFGRTRKEYDDMTKAWDRSGLSASVDKSALINGSMESLMNEGLMLTGKSRMAMAPLQYARKAGFDIGERLNILSAWLAHRDKLIKAGKTGNEMEDLASAQSRNFTYNMNRAGDMPYNQNALGMLFQFMQVPHKAFLTWTTNRALSASDKASLLVFNTMMYSLPPAAMYNYFGDILPEDPEYRDMVVQGLEAYTLNKLITMATGEKTSIDFSGLSPMDVHGVQEFIANIWTSEAGSLIGLAPSASLFAGHNPRITEAMRTWSRFFNIQGESDVQDPVSLTQLAKANASIFSGFSNAFKAKYALETGKKLSISGNITDENVSTAEAIAQAFGFPTMDEAQRAWIGNDQYKQSKSFNDDVKAYYSELKRHLAREGISVQEMDFVVRAMNDASKVFGTDAPKARKLIKDQLVKDIQKGDDMLFKKALELTQWPDAEAVRTQIMNIPDQDYSKKQDMLSALDYIDSYKQE